MILEFVDRAARESCLELGWSDADAVLADPRGFTVRCTPARRTLYLEVQAWFKKLRTGSPSAALAEWRWLHALPARGLVAARPICLAVSGRDSALVTAAVRGQPVDAWLARGLATPRERRELAREAGEVVRRLHGSGLCHRDLYWNHIVRTEQGLVLLDVERVFAPRWRLGRWIRKDLAGLASSLPRHTVTRPEALRLLRAYRGGELGTGWKPLVRAVLAKARDIQGHRPKYG